jgi:kumamolisin
MKKFICTALLICSTYIVHSEQRYSTGDGTYIIPDRNLALGDDKVTHDIIVFKPNAPAFGALDTCETPASMACIYGLTTLVPGCPIHGTTINPTGGWGAIAVIESFHAPDAEHDLHRFSEHFDLPECSISNGCFTLVYASGTRPPDNPSSIDEHALDIEWAHAMAPQAKIIMVEADDDSLAAHIQAIDVANQLVSDAGGGLISISWSIPEFLGENAYDHYFQEPGIVYIASSGDYSAPARYPSSSPYVVSAGGTSILRDVQGNFIGEAAWSSNPNAPIGAKSGGSGGPSLYEPRPSYQNSVMKIVGSARGTPDIAFNSDPATGVCVYSTAHGGWLKDGGTSVAAPALAGIINSANHRARSSYDELSYIYNNALKNYHSYWHDILDGNNGFPALTGYDFTTGLGSPSGYGGK